MILYGFHALHFIPQMHHFTVSESRAPVGCVLLLGFFIILSTAMYEMLTCLQC